MSDQGNPIEKELELPFPIVRVTLLGSHDAGKTALIHSLVSNTQDQSKIIHEHTLKIELYYRMLLVKNRPVLLELEDTPSRSLLCVQDWTNLSDDIKLSAPLCEFISPTAGPPIILAPDESDLEPLSIFSAPFLNNNKPITPHRMVYLVVFDLSNELSCKEAMDIYQLIKIYKARVEPAMVLSIFMVGTRCDCEEIEAQETMMQEYATAMNLPYFAVESPIGLGVEKMFRDVWLVLCVRRLAKILCFSKSVMNTPLVLREVIGSQSTHQAGE